MAEDVAVLVGDSLHLSLLLLLGQCDDIEIVGVQHRLARGQELLVVEHSERTIVVPTIICNLLHHPIESNLIDTNRSMPASGEENAL